MIKNILIIDSTADKNEILINLVEKLGQENYFFHLISSNREKAEQFREKKLPTQKINLGPVLKNGFNSILFTIFLVFFYIKFLTKLFYYKIDKKIKTVICLSSNEKIIITPIAKMLKLKVIWLELPDAGYDNLKSPLKQLYRAFSRQADLIIAFNEHSKIKLGKLKINKEKIKIIFPGVESGSYQENLFNKLAQNDKQRFHHKYFTVGTIVDLDQKQKIKTIFQAIKTCVPVIPSLQLIIVGDGEERKDLAWLSKKMEIDNLVWFVGEQKQLKKWLDSFDVFVVGADLLKINDYGNLLRAMAAKLPVVGPRYVGLEDFVVEDKTGFLAETNNSEMLARLIIKLHQEKKLRLQLGKNGKERIDNLFTIDKMINDFKKIL